MSEPRDMTDLLRDAGAGDGAAVDSLFPAVYDELRRLAESHLRQERPDHSLQATALVHEAYLRIIDQDRVQWRDRAHFFAVAATAIRRILVDHARGKKRQKRGGGVQRLSLDENLTITGDDASMLALDDALASFSASDPEKAKIVEMRFFGGLTTEDIADVLGVSSRTVERHWQYARAWLFRAISEGPESGAEADSGS